MRTGKDLTMMTLAEREGFEPSVEFPLHTLSKRAPSTTRTSLRVEESAVYSHSTITSSRVVNITPCRFTHSVQSPAVVRY